MRPVSARYLAAVRDSHEAVTRVRFVTPGQEGVTPTGVELKLTSGALTLDANAVTRTYGSLTLAEPWSDDGTGIAPYGQELYVERAIVYGNGQREFVGLGYLRIVGVEQPDAPLGELQVEVQDRMSAIVDGRLLAPVQYLPTELLGDIVESLVTEVLPGQSIEWDDADELTAVGRVVVCEEDRYGFLNELVTSLGKVWFFDHRGVLVVRDPPDALTPVSVVDAGRGGVLATASRGLSRAGVFNAVKATGEAFDDALPVFAVAYDLNPASRTYWEGPFGKVPRFYSSPFITTTAQALKAAENLLAGSLGLPYSVDFSMVPNVALEPLDPVQLVYPPDLTKHPRVRREVHVIDTLSVPLVGASTMRATTRVATLGSS